jgi:hypothetical protein
LEGGGIWWGEFKEGQKQVLRFAQDDHHFRIWRYAARLKPRRRRDEIVGLFFFRRKFD